MFPLLCHSSRKSYYTRLKKKEHDPEWLIRACMRFELLELALELVLALIHSVRFSPWMLAHHVPDSHDLCG